MAKTAPIDLDLVCALLDYNSETGDLTWRISTGRTKRGHSAGSMSQHGYVKITVQGRTLLAHRLAWAIYHKAQPPEIVDHINGIRTDNRICNLRSGEECINQQNQKKAHARNKTSQYLGVSMFHGRWRAKIYHKGKYIFLGYHATEIDAYCAYLEAKRKIHEGCEI